MPAPALLPLSCRRVILALVPLLLSNCTNLYYYGASGMSGHTSYLEGYDPGDSRYMGQPTDTHSWWRGDGVPGSPHIVISVREQQAYFYKGGKLVGVSALSTGDWDHPTPRGHFVIQQKDRWHQSSVYGDYVDSGGRPVMQNIDRNADPQPRGTHFD